MFWADAVAQELKKRKLPLEWVDDMKTPSGKIHVGALRGVVVHDLAYKALLSLGVKAKYTYVFEDQDPMDGLPVYLDQNKYQQYMGLPLFKVPSPEKGYENYARYYASDFKKVFNAIGCNPEIIWVTDLYKSGRMNDCIKQALDKSQEIKKIYEAMYKKQISDPWYPFQVYCVSCGKVSTTKVTDWDGKEVTFTCNVDAVKYTKGCGFIGKASPFSDEKEVRGKLPWKVEWPAKWKTIGITVEGGGKDHMSAGGSYDLSSQIAKKIFAYSPPFALPYEFFLVGGKKMSSSKGLGSSASDMLEILPPELLRFLMVKTKINQAINFDPAEKDTISTLFDEYQKAAEAYFEKTSDDLARTFELSQIDKVKKPPTVRFSVLAQWVQMPNMDLEIKKEGLEEWAKYARIWVERFAPESEKFVVQKELPEQAKNLSGLQKQFLARLSSELDKNWIAEDLQKNLFEWAKELGVSSKDAFAAIYLSLIGKDHGPKAGWIILSLDKEFVKKRFNE
ncbi:MAG: lysine--tRNA ligase [Candidatus Levyibacteriota bacterium]|nr:MAG: lysine--tRNA ligase [Candidatus Levybacteria bacterium]